MQSSSHIALIQIADDLDVTNVDSVRRSIDDLIEGGCRRIVLNMEGSNYIDSAGMSMIICEARVMRQLGGLISLINLSDDVYRILKIIGMVDMIPATRLGTRLDIPELPGSVVPSWRKTLLVNPMQMSDTRYRLQELLAEVSLTADEAFDLMLACGEAIGNAVDHTTSERVLVTLESYPDRVVAEISDSGKGIDTGKLDEAGEWPALQEGSERGRGIKLMQLLSDAVSITRRTGGHGTVVRLVKMVHVE